MLPPGSGKGFVRSLDDALEVMKALSQAVQGRVPLWCKPNAGLPTMEGEFPEYETTPQQMASYAAEFIGLGARVVGGCCGSTPEHIAAIAQAVERYMAGQ